jgi:DNA (cytosine-5)-methyltransferase 1
LNEVVKTDIPTDRKTGKPRGFFRDRSWVPRFFEHHRVRTGDKLELERLGRRCYRLSPEASYTAAEFFAGIGLVRLALEHQRWQVVFANDIDPDKAEMYRHNWPNDGHLVVGDIHALTADHVPTVDLATASFPCNDLSIAGRWEGLNGKQSSSFWGLVRILQEMANRRPPLLLLENVVGFLMSHGGRDLEQALVALNEIGYAMDALILNAVHWVTQSPARLFLIGKQKDPKDCRSFAMQSDVRPKALWEFIAQHRDIVAGADNKYSSRAYWGSIKYSC